MSLVHNDWPPGKFHPVFLPRAGGGPKPRGSTITFRALGVTSYTASARASGRRPAGLNAQILASTT